MHRLVAATFLGLPSSPDLQVNHKDLDRGNNHVDNLEWVTASENAKHARYARVGLGSQQKRGRSVQARLHEPDSPWLQFKSIAAAAAHTGIQAKKISRLCRGFAQSCGWEFRFVLEKPLQGEQWRPVVFEGARRPEMVGC